MLRSTHTFVELEVSSCTYDEIYSKLKEAGYDHAFIIEDGKTTIDMRGIGVVRRQKPSSQPSPGWCDACGGYFDDLIEVGGICGAGMFGCPDCMRGKKPQ